MQLSYVITFKRDLIISVIMLQKYWLFLIL